MANGFSRDRLARLHHGLAAHVAAADMPGVVALVSRHGEVHVEAAGTQSFDGPPMKRDTIFRIASMTKPVIAAVTLMLVEEGKLRLDDPVDAFLPELADRKVLGSIDGAVDDTVPARRPITARDLLTFTFGMGAVMVWPAQYPIQHAAAAVGLAPGPVPPDYTADEFMKRLGSLPLFYQPGERWLYHTGSDVLGVLIARVTGQPLETVLRERLFAPLGMRDTGFQVPAAKLDRFASAYMMDPQEKKLRFFDDAANSHWSKPPKFASGGGGLVSTVDDVHAFYRMMIGYGLPRGEHSGERLLARPTVELMMSDQLTSEQKQGAELFFGHGASWGMGGAVVTRRTDIFATPGRFGWDGGYGTSAHLDPAEDMIGILMTQRLMESPVPPKVFRDFWTGAYQAFND
ncbi:MAG: serine hydrolase domain-containing protein [Reyranellales bacterium]